MNPRPLRLMIYDATCTGRHALPGLSHAWSLGGHVYGALGRVHARLGARSWGEALAWLADVEPGRPIEEIQFWGHGHWGQAFIGVESLDARSIVTGHDHEPWLARIRQRLTGQGALWWFRTCETLGARPGQRFATAWSRYFDCRVAGHTYIIHVWQSGLHVLAPGQAPGWSAEEGVAAGSPEAPRQALNSAPFLPKTIHCLRGTIPSGW